MNILTFIGFKKIFGAQKSALNSGMIVSKQYLQ